MLGGNATGNGGDEGADSVDDDGDGEWFDVSDDAGVGGAEFYLCQL